ncbi:MAG: UDP-N-acetylmuramoyl-L-alanyl-D-glutamate--2,6-diaminopimelate ligase [Steroidobacteraceae bacterium]
MNALAIQSPVSASHSLRTLLRGLIDDASFERLPDITIDGIGLDSRKLVANSMFIAVPGLQGHGLDYALQAASRGATVMLWQPDAERSAPALPNVFALAVPGLSTLLGELASRFYAQPSTALEIAAVTGTNGKSTTAYLIADAAERCGLAAGYSGTVGYGRINALHTATHTTPDVFSVHRQLAELRDTGAQVVGMEVSSHALHQARIAAMCVDTAVFTNLSRDHLDYHGDMQAYGEAKALLFQWPELRHRVINADDAFGRELLSRDSTAALTTAYSCDAARDLPYARVLRAGAVRLSAQGMELDITGSFGNATLRSALLGRFNAENLLAALAVLVGWNVPLLQAVQVLQQAVAPPGRMELLQATNNGVTKRAVIDYAHTPDALEKALTVLKQHAQGRVICVFGCGGDRDAGKRPQMGAVAARLADQVVLTDDNPRSEDPAKIITAIQSGMTGLQGHPFTVQHDRAKAIELALQDAGEEDIVLIAGKGHEDYQIIGFEARYFSDREVALACLRRLG